MAVAVDTAAAVAVAVAAAVAVAVAEGSSADRWRDSELSRHIPLLAFPFLLMYRRYSRALRATCGLSSRVSEESVSDRLRLGVKAKLS